MYKRGTIYPVIYKAGLKTSRYFEGYWKRKILIKSEIRGETKKFWGGNVCIILLKKFFIPKKGHIFVIGGEDS